MDSPIIIALDGLSIEESVKIAEETKELVWGFKVHDLLIREGFGVIAELKKYGKVFVDLKFHDIPATVEKEVTAVVSYGADLITVHASGGSEMLKAAVQAGREKIAAVTILTSLSQNETMSIYRHSSEEVVREFTKIAHEAGAKNIVCSPHEIQIVKEVAPGMKIITPGIRAQEDSRDDQGRTASAKEALAAGASLLVIGRPITKAPDSRVALENILASLS